MGFLQKLPSLNEIKGSFGEYLSKLYLKTQTDAFILHDVLIDSDNCNTTQIDLIMIGEKGIYVTEVKNYAENASIYGDGNKKDWYYYLNGKKYTIYSPLMQNENHIRHLKKQLILPKDIPFFSVIIMMCKDFKVTNINHEGEPPRRVLCNSLPAMEKGLSIIAKNHSTVLTKEQKQAIYEKIQSLQHTEKNAKAEHKERVKSLKKEYEKIEEENLCPYCKIPLIPRNGKYGNFYGCSNYPKCKFTKKL